MVTTMGITTMMMTITTMTMMNENDDNDENDGVCSNIDRV